MSSYRGSGRQDRAKAVTAVVLVHVALGAVILSGLNVTIVQRTVERMQMFDIELPKPPPPPPPPPPPEQRPERETAEGAPEKKPTPAPVVAPKPVVRLPVRSPVRTADVPGTGSASTAGAGGRGTGTGLGGTGTGTGRGSGTGRFVPAQKVTSIPNREYRGLARVSGMRSGRVGVMVKVNTDGRPSDCRIVRSSGSPAADSMMCQLTLSYVRFRPAIDPQGRPVAQDISWFPNWTPNR